MSYEGRERRTGQLTEDRVALMIQEAVADALKAHEQHLMLHMDRQFAELRRTFGDAFPNGDPHGHRVAHERIISSAGEWDALKRGIVEKVIGGGIWAAIGFALLAIWDAIKREVSR